MKNIESFLNYTETEGSIHLPNEIFKDLQKNIKSPKHLAFAYSYYYAVNYLYRYSKYNIKRYTQQDLKAILGYNKDNKRIDYIVKKGGILDTMGYTQTVQDYPIENWLDVDNKPTFLMYSEYKKENYDELKQVGLHNDRHYFVKYPVKAFYRTKEAEQDGVMDGTFYETSRTHGIPVADFLLCMSHEEIGTLGFYLYGYLKHKIDWYKGYFKQSLELIAEATGLSKNTVIKYKNTLEKHGLIVVTYVKYITGDKTSYGTNIYRHKH